MYETNDCHKRPARPMEPPCHGRPPVIEPLRPVMPPRMHPMHPMHMCPMIMKCLEMCMMHCCKYDDPYMMSEAEDYENMYSVDMNEINPHIPAK